MKINFIFLIFLLPLCCGQNENHVYESQNKSKKTQDSTHLPAGSIVFQNSQSKQCKAIELATHSSYTHCGIIFWKQNKCMVLEAVQPVKYTSLEEWIERGKNKHYVVKQLKNTVLLNDSITARMRECGEKYLDKDYDIYFEWTDEQIYCSELVWKIYKDALGIEIAKLKKLKDFDLSSKEVKRIMKERYGNNIPYEEPVISPADIFNSELIETVFEN